MVTRALLVAGVDGLHLAALRGHRRVVELLLGGGSDPGAKTNDGRTALALATLGRHHVLAELLRSRR